MIPLMLDISRLRVLVFGSGPVGTRKAQYFAEEAASVTMLDKDDTANLSHISQQITCHDIIIAATDNHAFNETVVRLAKEQNKWVNSATGPGNFLIPAAFQTGDVSIAVSTNGKAPAVSAYLRNRIEREFPALSQMVELQDKLRTVLKQGSLPQSKRAEILRQVLDDDAIWKALEENDGFEAEKRAWRYL